MRIKDKATSIENFTLKKVFQYMKFLYWLDHTVNVLCLMLKMHENNKIINIAQP